MRNSRKLSAVALSIFVFSAMAGEAGELSELPSLEEIDRQLNNPLSKTWALTLQDNFGIQDGDLVTESTTSNVLFFQPLLPVPVGKGMMFSGRPVFPLVTAPNVDLSTGESDGHTTGFGDLQLMTLIGPDKADGWVWGVGATFKFPTASDPTKLMTRTSRSFPAKPMSRKRPHTKSILRARVCCTTSATVGS